MSNVTTPDGFFTRSGSLIRPAGTVTYAQYALVGDSASAAAPLEIRNVTRAFNEASRIETLRLRKSSNVLLNASFRVHLFRTLPVLTVNDAGILDPSGAGVLAVADISGYLGSVDIVMNRAGVLGARGEASFSPGKTFEGSGSSGSETSAWALIQTLAGYAAASAETFTVTLEGARC